MASFLGRFGFSFGFWPGLKSSVLLTGGEPPTDIVWNGSLSVPEDSPLGTHVGDPFSIVDTDAGDTVTYTIVSQTGRANLFDIQGDQLIVSGVLDYETATFHDLVIRATDSYGQTYDESFRVTVTDVDETPPIIGAPPPPSDTGGGTGGNTDPGGGGVIIVPEPPPPDPDLPDFPPEPPVFVVPPIATVVDDGIKFHGKKGNGASGKFIYDIQLPQPGYTYTMLYDPDFTLLENHGKQAMVGFGFKRGNNFHLVGLKGDGGTGLNKTKIYGTKWNQSSGATVSNGGNAHNGTQAGPNWLQMEISEDGDLYTLRSSVDGVVWVDEYTASTSPPETDPDRYNAFGIAVWLDAEDAGNFSVFLQLWITDKTGPWVTLNYTQVQLDGQDLTLQ